MFHLMRACGLIAVPALMALPVSAQPEPDMTHVKPGAIGEVLWNFNRAGEFEFACLIAGRYQAGMVGKIKVAATQRK